MVGNRQQEPENERPKIKERSFITEAEIRNGKFEGMSGFFIRILLPSYRSLPLSCIGKIELSIDGTPVDPGDIVFILNGYSHKVSELGQLSKIFWFILDYADLFIPGKEPLSQGDHLVKGTMVTVEPYMTVGRFPFFYTSEKRLSVETGI
jgi:hypothetical protein